ncbi:DNA-processing protein DprA [Mesonia sp. K4-1]|uniref:DNA-processing protein DprA n=1 Tax=Mesonia sp. K4-1 TaxID=2602760 RepID=UPI0011C7FF33|nr:DNA-processing protein DprA [Mesonia sp. K4-1]TXK78605.1 DNA-protecting protein DprA [Mesonia sp. K4-1]
MSEQELIYLLALQKVPNIGDISAKKLLRTLGSAEAIFKSTKKELKLIEGFGDLKINSIHDSLYMEEAEQELLFIEKENIEVRYFEDRNYPDYLKHCIDAPILLFQKGNIDLAHKKIVSIVGTRKVTTHGVAFCEQLIEELAPLNPVIVSGFAYGVDICAHKAAMAHGLQTIGCLAHGLDQIYPKAHAKYENEVMNHGGFMTDFWSGSYFDRKNFLKRNRIIAGLSEVTIVIESAEKGGSLVTADIANSYNREVFAVPGRNTDQLSKGCNNLIKTQQARLLTNVADLVYVLNWDIRDQKKQQTQLFVELSTEEQFVFDTLKKLGKSEVDVLALQCKLPTFKLNPILLVLELKGVVRPLPGKQFEVI